VKTVAKLIIGVILGRKEHSKEKKMKNIVSVLGKWTLVAPEGRIDGHTSPELDLALREIIDGGAKNVALNLTGVEYMSSAGLRVLLATYKTVKALEGDMALISPRDNVAEVLEISGFSGIFRIIDNSQGLD
jgi:anti-sigma B factor antagonist